MENSGNEWTWNNNNRKLHKIAKQYHQNEGNHAFSKEKISAIPRNRHTVCWSQSMSSAGKGQYTVLKE